MSKQSERWLVEFALRIAAEQCGEPNGQIPLILAAVNQVMELSRIATGLHRIQVTECERSLSEREESRIKRFEARATAIIAGFGAGFEFVPGSGDARGAPMFVKCPSGYYDDWGKRGLIVPYSQEV